MKIAPFNEDTMHLFEFHRFFFKENSRHSVDLKGLLSSYSGYLFINLSTANNTHKKLDKLEIDGTKYYILNGTYFAPFASQLVMNIEVNGIMLDTTWSIPIIIIQNVGIPIGMSFGLTEDASIYNEFFFHFHNIYGYEIPDFVDVVESDQGKALIKAVHDQGMRHICYLRHLLVSLG